MTDVPAYLDPRRFGFPGLDLDPRSKSAKGPKLLADLLEKEFEQLCMQSLT